MAIALANSNVTYGTANNNTQVTINLPNTSSSGNLIVVCILINEYPTVPSTSSVTDSKSNVYAAAGAGILDSGGGYNRLECFYAKNATGGASHSITVTVSAEADYIAAAAVEISGCDTTAPYVDSGEQAPTTSSAPTSDAIDNGAGTQECAFVGAMTHASGTRTLAIGSGFTEVALYSAGNFAAELKIATADTAIAFTLTGGDASRTMVYGASFKAAAGAAASAMLLRMQTEGLAL